MDARGATLLASARLTARERRLLGGGVVDQNAQVRALLDAAAVLDRLGVPHALIGGLAVGVRSDVPRATMDVDLAVASSVGRERLVSAMIDAGFDHRATHTHSINFRHASGEPVQLALDPRFDAFIARAERIRVAERTVPVVTREDLITMKRWAAASPARRRSKALRDQADVHLLQGDVGEPDEGW